MAFPKPKSRTVRYEITDATSEYRPYSFCPIVCNIYGVYISPTAMFNTMMT